MLISVFCRISTFYYRLGSISKRLYGSDRPEGFLKEKCILGTASEASSCPAILPNLARLGPVIKIKTNFKCRHVIFIIVMVTMNFSWISYHFSVYSVCLADHSYHQKISDFPFYPLSLLPLGIAIEKKPNQLPIALAKTFFIDCQHQ